MKANIHRAGRYIRQPAGYQAFIPAPLPPKPPVAMAGLQNLLSRADRALGRLDGSVLTLPNPDLFVFMYVRKEAVLSSQIEGTQSSLQDVLAAEARIFNRERPSDVWEVLNYIDAMRYGLERLHKLPVSVRLIREIHEHLLHEVRGGHLAPGELRTSQNWIGPAGCTLNEASFVPPPPGLVPELLSDLERFLHQQDDLPALIRIGLAHAQFETIHPFLDGNGRVGRLLITFLLCSQEILHKPVLYLSYYFKRYRQAYYDHLQAVRDRGDWEGWLAFFLRGVIEVSQQATETARRILLMREEHRNLITENMGYAAGNAHRVLEQLYERPIMAVKDVREITGTSYAAANQLVKRLEQLGLLEEITGQSRNRRFRYAPYIRVFADEETEAPVPSAEEVQA
ncbi:MAG: Fic family protein [Chloroflexi bacterium]|nr:MAG: Fic family protein [Chloroflexota bacterium]